MNAAGAEGFDLRVLTALDMSFDLPAIVLLDLDEASRTLPLALPEETDAALGRYPRAEHFEHAARHVRRRQVLRMLAARSSGHTAASIAVRSASSGAPLVHPASLGLHASLSHRGSLTAFGLALQPIGVDIEPDRPVDPLPLALLHSDERCGLEALREPDRSFAFLKLWTLKEACVKALRTGFETPPDSFAIAWSDTGAPPRITGFPAAVRLCHRVVVDPVHGPVHLGAALVGAPPAG